MIKTINLLANVEQAVEVTGGVHARFENLGDGTVYVSKSANVTEGGDGVIAVPSGATKYMKNVAAYGEYSGEYGYQGTVYVKADTSCSVEIETGDYFFKSINSGKGGAVSGKFVKIKGRIDTVDDLPLIADEGDLYFVGAESDENSDEYVYTADGKWEQIGNTEVDLSGYVKDTDMKNTYGIEKTTVPTIESKVEENAVTLGYGFDRVITGSDTTITKGSTVLDVRNFSKTGDFIAKFNIDATEYYSYQFVVYDMNKSSDNVIFDSRSMISKFKNSVYFNIPNEYTNTRVFLWVSTSVSTEVSNITVYQKNDNEPYKPSVDERLNKKQDLRFYSQTVNSSNANNVVRNARDSIYGANDQSERRYLLIVSYPTSSDSKIENPVYFVGIINFLYQSKLSWYPIINNNVTISVRNTEGTIVMQRSDGGTYENSVFTFIALD